MTYSEFQTYCEDIATETANEDWLAADTLARIRSEIGLCAIDFDSDTDSELQSLEYDRDTRAMMAGSIVPPLH
jgi:hypothetical protein